MAEINVSVGVSPRTGQRVVQIAGPDGLGMSLTPDGARELAVMLFGEAAAAEQEANLGFVMARREYRRAEALAVLHELRTLRGAT